MTVKEMREKRNMTQEELAEAIGCSRITIARMEAGRAPSTLKILAGLSVIFGVSIDEIGKMITQQADERAKKDSGEL